MKPDKKGSRETNPLCVEICWLSIHANKVAINSRLVNAIKLPLVFEEIRLTKRPRLRHRQPIQLVSNLNQSLVRLVEPFVNLPFAVQWSVGGPQQLPRNHNAHRSRTISVHFQHRSSSPLRDSWPWRGFPSAPTNWPPFSVPWTFSSCFRRLLTSDPENWTNG